MSFISPQLIARIYHALGQDRGSEAVRLLRQHQFSRKSNRDCELMTEVVRLADQSSSESDWQRAEDHYKLGLALYGSCFKQSHTEALRCAAGLIGLAERRNDIQAMLELTETLQTINKALRECYMKPKAVAV